jgi:hypothetical protein
MLSALSIFFLFVLLMTVLVIVVAEFLFLVSNIELKVVSVRIGHFECDLSIVI